MNNQNPSYNLIKNAYFLIWIIIFQPILSYAQEMDVIQRGVKNSNSGIKAQNTDGKYSKEEIAYVTGYLYETKGAVSKAMDFYKEALSINVNYLPARINLAILLFEKEKYRQAMAHFFKIYQENKDSSLAFNNYGLALLLKGNKKEALKILLEGVRKFPTDYELRFNLATVYYKSNELNSAKKEYRYILRFNKNDYATLNNLGCAHISLKEYSDALKVLKKAIRINRKYSQGFYNLAFAFWKMKYSDKALWNIKRTLSRNPNHRLARALKVVINQAKK